MSKAETLTKRISAPINSLALLQAVATSAVKESRSWYEKIGVLLWFNLKGCLGFVLGGLGVFCDFFFFSLFAWFFCGVVFMIYLENERFMLGSIRDS